VLEVEIAGGKGSHYNPEEGKKEREKSARSRGSRFSVSFGEDLSEGRFRESVPGITISLKRG